MGSFEEVRQLSTDTIRKTYAHETVDPEDDGT